eukprot:scaffold18417_cov39-Phaeocystis_antarctica.AAC.2
MEAHSPSHLLATNCRTALLPTAHRPTALLLLYYCSTTALLLLYYCSTTACIVPIYSQVVLLTPNPNPNPNPNPIPSVPICS